MYAYIVRRAKAERSGAVDVTHKGYSVAVLFLESPEIHSSTIFHLSVPVNIAAYKEVVDDGPKIAITSIWRIAASQPHSSAID